jgi:hypothetical protein
MLHYFGKQDGQSLTDFQKELAALTKADKAWFAANLETVGYEIAETALAA